MFLFIACKGILSQINSGIGMAQDIFTTGKGKYFFVVLWISKSARLLIETKSFPNLNF
jgi:hypothetical protein